MALQTTTTINIGGKEISSIQNLKLHQEIAEHQKLTIVCRMDVLEKRDNELAQESKNLLGENVTLQIEPAEGFGNNQELRFKGIITEVKTIKGHDIGTGDNIVITAKSPDFLANDGVHYASYNDVSLSEIINKSLQEYPASKLEVNIRPNNDITLHYSVQHKESAYQYVNRLAKQYGEWFYYDGAQLIFGTPDTEEIELTYGFDLKEYELKLLPKPSNYKFFASDYIADEIHEKSVANVNVGLNGYGAFVSNKSADIFNKENKVWHNLYNDSQTQQRLDTVSELQKKAIEVKQIQVSGNSDNLGVKIGNIITIEGSKYRITSIVHTNNEVGDYTNVFEGITADIGAYPFTDINTFPKSESQTAVVKENADPEKLGRVRVQFPWQEEENELTPWIRVITPHGGKDKGFHFIPEVEEKVLVGFEGGNAEHPYVLGVLYTGNTKPEEFATETNDVKVIRTRSGHTIELNDKEGEEKINIYDNEGSIITFDTQEKSLHITATENIELQAKNIKITAEEDINIEAKGNISSAAERDIAIQSKGKTNIQAQQDATVKSNAKVVVNATSEAEIKGQNVKVEGSASAELKGMQTTVQGQITAVKGASGKVDIM